MTLRHFSTRATILTTLALLFLSILGAQQLGTRVTVDPFPAPMEPTKKFIYSGNTLTYICFTTPFGPWNNNFISATNSWTISGSTLTSIVDSSNTATVTTVSAHGLQPGNPVTVSGVTGDSDLNGSYVIQTVPSTTTFTITTANVTDNTLLPVQWSAPRLVSGSSMPVLL